MISTGIKMSLVAMAGLSFYKMVSSFPSANAIPLIFILFSLYLTRFIVLVVFQKISNFFGFSKAFSNWTEFFAVYLSGMLKGPMTLMLGTKYISNNT